jgi:CRP-like cAMP-binding protein
LRQEPLEEFFRQVPLFQDFTPDELTDLRILAQPFSVPGGARLFNQGTPAQGLYVIERGTVQILARTAGDAAVELARVGPREVIGEVSLLDRGSHAAGARALEPVAGYLLGSGQFDVLLGGLRSSAFKISYSIARILCGRIRQRIADLEPRGRRARGRDYAPPGPRRAEPGLPAAHLTRPDIVRALPLFRPFAPGELREFLAMARVLEKPRGAVLLREGGPPASCYVVVRGALHLGLADGAASAQIAILGPGRMAGEIALTDGLPQPVACTVREPAVLLELPRKRFEALRERRDPLAFRFFDQVSQSLVAIQRKTVRNTTRIASQHANHRAKPRRRG